LIQRHGRRDAQRALDQKLPQSIEGK
jgi:hypothetical protein